MVFEETTGLLNLNYSDTATNSSQAALKLKHTTTADMIDGFSTNLNFIIRDGAAVDNTIGSIYSTRNGADDQGKLRFGTHLTGSPATTFAEFTWDGTTLDVGTKAVSANTYASVVTTGTAPFSVLSTTLVDNLNVKLLNGQEGSFYLAAANITGTVASINGGTGLNTSASTGVPSISEGTWSVNTVLPLSLGGTNANLTASNGGIFYSTATAAAILSGTVTANQVLLSGLSSAPSWSTATYPATTTINQLLYSSAANTVVGLATANNAVLITSAGGVPSLGTSIPTAVTIGGSYIYRAGGTDVAAADGGTGGSSAAETGVPYVSAGVWSYSNTITPSTGTLTVTGELTVNVGTVNRISLGTTSYAIQNNTTTGRININALDGINVNIDTNANGADAFFGVYANAPTETGTQIFRVGETTSWHRPITDGLTAFQFRDKDGNNILNVDSINNRIGIGNSDPKFDLHIGTGSSITTGFNNGIIITSNPATRIYLEDTSQPANKKLMSIISTSQKIFFASLNDAASAFDKGSILTLSRDGNVGIGTSTSDKALEINHPTGACLRLTYNDADGGALNYSDFSMSSGGNLTIAPSGGVITLNSAVGITGTITVSDTKDFIFSTGTGTKFGTSTSQKIGFYNAVPVIQQAGTGETIGFTAGAGTAVNDASTFTGNVGLTAYRISDLVKAMKNLGLLAS